MGKFTGIDYLLILVRWKKFILANVIIFGMLAAAYSLIMPKTYRASAVLLPPGQTTNLLSALPINLPNFNLGNLIGGVSEETNVVLAILSSRTLAESVIKKFNLIEKYEAKTIEHALITFGKKVDYTLEKEGTIRISYDAETGFFHPEQEEMEARQLCSDIVNYMVSKVDSINSQLQSQRAKYYRIFIEKRYKENIEELYQLEEKIKEFGEKYGIISLPEQLAATIKTAANLEGQLIMEEINLEVLQKILNSDNPEIKKKELTIQHLKQKLSEIVEGTSSPEGNNPDLIIFPPFKNAPKLGVEYLRLQRELEVQKILYEFLTQQYEQAKIQEAKDTPTLQILDPAQVPILRIKPKRKVFVLLIMIIVFILNIFWVYIVEYFRFLQTSDPEKFEKVNQILNGFKVWK